jgi:hypothetical protein
MPLEIHEDLYEFSDPNNFSRTMNRYFYLHRLDFKLFNRISLGLMEGVMVGNSPPEIRFLNPLMIFHSFFSWWNYDVWDERRIDEPGHMIGSVFSVELNYNITTSLALYGQFIMNEFATSHELSIDPEQPPNGIGYMAGLRFTHSFDTWGSMFFAEFINTDPYLHILSTPFGSFIHMRYLSWVNGRHEYKYIGYPRDTIALTLGAKFFKGDVLSLSGEFSWLSRGSHNKDGLKWDWFIKNEKGEYANQQKTPSGTAENTFLLSLAARWKFLSYLAMNIGVTGIVVRNNEHNPDSNEIGGQTALSLNFIY